MCDLKAYVKKQDKEELLLEAVNLVRTEGDDVIVRNLFGEEKRVKAAIREVSLVRSRVILEAS
jgi:predicted RNA-binding protein